MKILSVRALNQHEIARGQLCGIERFGAAPCSYTTMTGEVVAHPYMLDENKSATHYVEFTAAGETITRAYIDADVLAYFRDCAMPAKIQYAREFAELKADYKAAKAEARGRRASSRIPNP
jgi:hypothetical protein